MKGVVRRLNELNALDYCYCTETRYNLKIIIGYIMILYDKILSKLDLIIKVLD